MPPRPPIARNLRYLWERDSRQEPWSALARELGVGERLVAAWRNDNETDPSWGNVLRLADYFDVPPEFFYADNPESRYY